MKIILLIFAVTNAFVVGFWSAVIYFNGFKPYYLILLLNLIAVIWDCIVIASEVKK